MSMAKRWWRCALGLALAFSAFETSRADEQSSQPTPTAEAAKAEPTPPTTSLPAYFSGSNPDVIKPTWPDPTGAAAGVWTTPAGDGKESSP